MNEQIKKQYDSLYSLEGSMYGDGGPLKIVTKLVDYIDKGKVLDIGGGEGRNALYLAERGFEVTVTDLSGVGLDKLQSSAKEKNLNMSFIAIGQWNWTCQIGQVTGTFSFSKLNKRMNGMKRKNSGKTTLRSHPRLKTIPE